MKLIVKQIMNKIFKLSPHIKAYDWGSSSKDSWVGKIAQLNSISSFPYAEAWFGNHVNGSSKIALDKSPKEESCNEESYSKLIDLDYQLNFLGKVLSISRPLSIQLHPRKSKAIELHNLQPELFKDDNEKNEIAIAISKLNIAAGFLSKEEIASRKLSFPSLNNISSSNNYKDLLEEIFKLEEEKLNKFCNKIYNAKSDNLILNKSIEQLSTLYPEGDTGVIVLLLMNIIQIEPGSAVYTPAGYPHAYLSGELIEIMTRSDNVIRAGLTSKNIDYSLFSECLSSETEKPRILTDSSSSEDKKMFSTDNLNVLISRRSGFINRCNDIKIMLSLDAKGMLNDKHEIIPLSSYFIEANQDLNLQIDHGRVVFFYSNSK